MRWLLIDPVLLMILAYIATKFFEGGSEVYGMSRIKGILLYVVGGSLLIFGFYICTKLVSFLFMNTL